VLNSYVLHTAFTGVCVKSQMSNAVYIEVFVKLWCIRHSLYWCVCVCVCMCGWERLIH